MQYLHLARTGFRCPHWPALPVADPENFGGGGFEAQNLKNSDVFTKIETDFSPDSLRLGRWGGMHPEMEPNYSK